MTASVNFLKLKGFKSYIAPPPLMKGGLEDFRIRKLGGGQPLMNDSCENQSISTLLFIEKIYRLWYTIASNHTNAFLFTENSIYVHKQIPF